MTDYARAERRQLADLLQQVGPDQPTVNAGWTTRDLAAHLAVRDRRPDAMIGMLIPPLAGHGEHVRLAKAARPYAEIVLEVRTPPWWSPVSNPLVDALTNTVEFFIHHEDVRRAQSGWAPRPPDEARDRQIWRAVGLLGRLSYRSSPVAVTLRRPDGAEHAVRSGPRTVILTGEPGELLLHAAGRDECVVHPEGEPADVAAVMALDRGL